MVLLRVWWMLLDGSPPLAAITRYSCAFSRASASETTIADPSPKSRRRPLTVSLKTHRLAQESETYKYSPPPSVCRPGGAERTNAALSCFSKCGLRRLPRFTGSWMVIFRTHIRAHIFSLIGEMVGASKALKSRNFVGCGLRWKLKKGIVAERQGFEPWEGLHPQRFSRPPRSTTPAPLRGGLVGAFRSNFRKGQGCLQQIVTVLEKSW